MSKCLGCGGTGHDELDPPGYPCFSCGGNGEVGGPQPIRAYRAWAINASYDGNAPDTSDLVLCATEALAQEIVAFLETDEGQNQLGGMCYNEGHEWCKAYQIREVATLKPDRVYDSLAKLIEDEEY